MSKTREEYEKQLTLLKENRDWYENLRKEIFDRIEEHLGGNPLLPGQYEELAEQETEYLLKIKEIDREIVQTVVKN